MLDPMRLGIGLGARKQRRLRERRVHPTILKEVKRLCRRYRIGEDSKLVAGIVSEVIRRLHLSRVTQSRSTSPTKSSSGKHERFRSPRHRPFRSD